MTENPVMLGDRTGNRVIGTMRREEGRSRFLVSPHYGNVAQLGLEVVAVKITGAASGGGKYNGCSVAGDTTAVATGDLAMPEGMTVAGSDDCLVLNLAETTGHGLATDGTVFVLGVIIGLTSAGLMIVETRVPVATTGGTQLLYSLLTPEFKAAPGGTLTTTLPSITPYMTAGTVFRIAAAFTAGAAGADKFKFVTASGTTLGVQIVQWTGAGGFNTTSFFDVELECTVVTGSNISTRLKWLVSSSTGGSITNAGTAYNWNTGGAQGVSATPGIISIVYNGAALGGATLYNLTMEKLA